MSVLCAASCQNIIALEAVDDQTKRSEGQMVGRSWNLEKKLLAQHRTCVSSGLSKLFIRPNSRELSWWLASRLSTLESLVRLQTTIEI